MTISLEFTPYITIFRNSMIITFNNTVLQELYDINNNNFYLVTTLEDEQGNELVYKGNNLTDTPINKTEGLNQINLNFNLVNGSYRVKKLEIVVNATTHNLIDNDSPLLKYWHIAPSIFQHEMRIL